MKKLFENVSGNQFRLLTESINSENKESQLLREAIKKIFLNGTGALPYKTLQNMGLGYIKDVFEAKKTALKEARDLAGEYGYSDNPDAQKFMKETHSEPNQSNPEEAREVQICKSIINQIDLMSTGKVQYNNGLWEIQKLAVELIKMHGAK